MIHIWRPSHDYAFTDVLTDTCVVPKKMSPLIHNCRDDYNWMDDDTKDYSPSWKPLNQSNMTEQCIEEHDKYDIWKYRNSLELMGSPYVGTVNTYKVKKLICLRHARVQRDSMPLEINVHKLTFFSNCVMPTVK